MVLMTDVGVVMQRIKTVVFQIRLPARMVTLIELQYTLTLNPFLLILPPGPGAQQMAFMVPNQTKSLQL